MRIVFSPSYRDYPLEMTKQGDVLTLNGVEFDFGPLLDGATLPAGAVGSEWLASSSEINRVGGELELTLILPHGLNAPESTRFATELVVTENGPVSLPVYDEPPAPADPSPEETTQHE